MTFWPPSESKPFWHFGNLFLYNIGPELCIAWWWPQPSTIQGVNSSKIIRRCGLALQYILYGAKNLNFVHSETFKKIDKSPINLWPNSPAFNVQIICKMWYILGLPISKFIAHYWKENQLTMCQCSVNWTVSKI